MKKKVVGGFLAFLVVAGAFAVAFPALAAPAGAPYGMGMRWLGIGGPGTAVEDAADALGMTVDEVWAAKADGKTLAELALEKGMSAEELAAAIAEIRSSEIDNLVNEGKVTQESANAAKANIEANVERAVNQECAGTCTGVRGGGNGCGLGRTPRGAARGYRSGR
jgi:hypothetical protein